MPAIHDRGAALRRSWLGRHPLAGVIALWLVAGSLIGLLSGRIRDWYVMTDELLYERLALGVIRLHSPFPHVNGTSVPNVAQLYPIVISPVIAATDLPSAVHDVHIWNAYVMASACIPTFLLARLVSRNLAAAYAAAVVAACVPWVVYSSFVLTEVAAYPAFAWAMLGITYSVQRPSRRADLLALGGIALAVLARAQFLMLAAALPCAILLYELTAATSESMRERLRSTLRGHRVLCIAYGIGLVLALALAVSGRAWYFLGTYRSTTNGNILDMGVPKLMLEHVAVVAFGLAVIPFVVALGWLLAATWDRERTEERAFALTGLVTLVFLIFEVASFDARFSNDGTAHDRYSFYGAPILIVACVAALARPRRLGAWLAAAALLVAVGFSVSPVSAYPAFLVGSPVSGLNWLLEDITHKPGTLLAVVSLLLIPLLWLAGRWGRWALAAIVAVAALGIPGQTAYAFHRLLMLDNPAGRSTLLSHTGADWVDRTLGRDATVTLVPYPTAGAELGPDAINVWDVLYWNASLERSVHGAGRFLWYPTTFPSSKIQFDAATGAANVSPSPYIVKAEAESRFDLEGHELRHQDHFILQQVDQPWRAAWVSSGLFPDGWTRANTPARIRIYPERDQTAARLVTLRLSIQAPQFANRVFSIRSNAGVWRGIVGEQPETHDLVVCLPADRPTDVAVDIGGWSKINGIPMSADTQAHIRRVGVQLAQIALSDGSGAICTPGPVAPAR